MRRARDWIRLTRDIDNIGSRVAVLSLAKPTEDPHFVDPKPSFVVKLAHADVLIEGGAELEIGWLPPLLDGARNPKLATDAPGRIAISPGIQLREVPTELDRSKGDVHAMGNPHFMTDPINGKIAAQRIAEGLAKIDAAGAETYRSNLAKFNARIDAKMVEWQKLLAPFTGKQVVAYHNTWPYFGERFGLKIDLFLEPKPGIPPTPASLAEIIGKMKAEHLRVVIVEPYQNRKTAEKVAAALGILLLSRSAEGNEELRRTLVGDVLLVRPVEVGKTFALYAVIAAVHFVCRRQFLALSLGKEPPRGRGGGSFCSTCCLVSR